MSTNSDKISPSVQNLTKEFLLCLKQSDFQGDVEDSYGARIVASTDNSVYQIIPEAIIYPKHQDDINHLVSQLADFVTNNPNSKLSIVARGGGTGTNGQSLNESLILDTSRYLNKIISFDEKTKLITVEPGVVLDQLNQFLAPYGLFFPPDVSTSSRATLGGMVATDASGKGSRVYGKTSNYIESMDIVLSDGSDFQVQITPQLEVEQSHEKTLANKIQKKVFKTIKEYSETIKDVFPQMNRGLTGYNLEHVLGADDSFDMSYLLAGSEGTLALSKKITFRVISKPKLNALVAVLYNNFDKTLEHVSVLLKAQPTAIEVLDDKILEVAQQDPLWQDVETSFKEVDLSDRINGLNFIEITAETEAEIEKKFKVLSIIINKSKADFGVISYLIETNPKIINSLWGIRKRAVGLLASIKGDRRPLAFVEDCAVPPENLPAFIKDFRKILDNHGLSYGMYGHADVGCLHVRPALDMTVETDQKLLRTISDEVAQLSKEYNGLLWGEHGRGFRGEYSPFFFGKELYPVLGEIKLVFDPNNIFNPGKLATPNSSSKVIKIDEVPFRGQYDGQISQQQGAEYKSAMLCNGNAACFSWDVSEAMCPSYKVTRDKRFSPKGRAAMIREWLRLKAAKGEGRKNEERQAITSLESELYDSLNNCLSCKSCTHSCPIKVDIPELKSRFLESYHQKQKRKISDYFFSQIESLARIGRSYPFLMNIMVQNPISITFLKKAFGVINPPRYSPSITKALINRNATFIGEKHLECNNKKSVILLLDSINASYNSSVILACYDVLIALGFNVLISPVLENGKAQHVKGYRDEFKKVAEKSIAQLNQLSEMGLPLISAEVVTRLMHSHEYPQITTKPIKYKVDSIEKWLLNEFEENPGILQKIAISTETKATPYKLLPHCMEQTADKLSTRHWQSLFHLFGLSLETVSAGCCGMSGMFGHEKENKKMAEKIYQQSWEKVVETKKTVLVTGFSCHCQLENHEINAKHPIEVLSERVKHK